VHSHVLKLLLQKKGAISPPPAPVPKKKRGRPPKRHYQQQQQQQVQQQVQQQEEPEVIVLEKKARKNDDDDDGSGEASVPEELSIEVDVTKETQSADAVHQVLLDPPPAAHSPHHHRPQQPNVPHYSPQQVGEETQSTDHVVQGSHRETFLTELHEFFKMLADIDDVWPDISASTVAAFTAALELKHAILERSE
jgi:hypothetical protein